MKKIIYLSALILGVILTGCDPLEDTYEDLDFEKVIESEVDYTLTDDDYETLGLADGSFNSIDDAKTLIPEILTGEYPVWGKGSLVNVSYLLYAPLSKEDYTVTDEDYSELEVTSLSKASDIKDFFEYKYETAAQGSYVNLTYLKLADVIAYELTAEDFERIEIALEGAYAGPASSAGSYSNFDRRVGNASYWSDEMIIEALNVILPDSPDGQQYNVTFAIYDGASGTETVLVERDEAIYEGIAVTPYELSGTDYDDIVAALSSTYPDATANMSSHGNFQRKTGDAAYWSDAMIVEALNVVLPTATTGERYTVTYSIYDGSTTGTGIMPLEYKDGAYEMPAQLLIEETTLYVLTDEWAVPYTVPEEAYGEMGQGHANFGDEDEALYKLAIYLSSVFPYAAADDMVAVAYNFYDGDVTIAYVNFVFNGSKWNAVESVIEQTFQFGHDGTVWVPDNTIAYTLTSEDYTNIAAEFATQYANAASSMGSYGNYDRREGNAAYWSDDMVLETVIFLLADLAPNAEEGQKYAVSYSVYNGSSVVEVAYVVKKEGVWGYQKES